ncbi:MULTISPECIES: hypothetical protein [unclassified Colwellia]|nr:MULTISPECIES: hypothetical protein [unclassified Colwellia]
MKTHLNQVLGLITDNKLALINFPEESILKGLPLILPPKES